VAHAQQQLHALRSQYEQAERQRKAAAKAAYDAEYGRHYRHSKRT